METSAAATKLRIYLPQIQQIMKKPEYIELHCIYIKDPILYSAKKNGNIKHLNFETSITYRQGKNGQGTTFTQSVTEETDLELR